MGQGWSVNQDRKVRVVRYNWYKWKADARYWQAWLSLADEIFKQFLCYIILCISIQIKFGFGYKQLFQQNVVEHKHGR